MRYFTLLFALIGAALVTADVRTTSLYIQPLDGTSSSSKPALLAEIRYDALSPSDAAAAEVTAYEPPELPSSPAAGLVRIGAWDPKAKRWAGSTTVAAARNFAKGFGPHFTLSVDGQGELLGAAVRGVRIDAGATRDFGPRARVVVGRGGAQPVVGRPVVLGPEGKKVAPEEEKTFLQKYWWLLGLGVLMLATGGGGGEK